MALDIDPTGLNTTKIIKNFRNMKVTDLDPLGKGLTTFPREIEIQSIDSDGSKLIAVWDGFPGLAVNDFCVVQRDGIDAVFYVTGVSGATSNNGVAGWVDDGTAVRLDTVSDSVGIGIATPDKKVEILDATGAQLRLTHTDASKFVDFLLDTNHDLTITTSSTGQIILQPTTDSTDFFQVLDTAGTKVLINADSTNQGVIFGSATALPDLVLNIVPVQVSNNGFTELSISSHDASGNPNLTMYLSKGTIDSPTVVADGNFVGSFFARGYDGTSYLNCAGLRFAVDGTPGTGDMPGRITFNVSADGTGNFAEKARISNTGFFGVGCTAAELLEIEDNNATTTLQISNSATDGDPQISFALSGVKTFTMGIDDGDSDTFKVGTTAVGTGTMLKLDSATGVVSMPTLPTSSAGLSAGDLWNNSGVVNIV